MTVAYEVVFILYSCVAAIIFIVMSCYGGAALRSTGSQVFKKKSALQLSVWVHKEMKQLLFFPRFCAGHFRQSLWWLQQEPYHQLSEKDERTLRRSMVRTKKNKTRQSMWSAAFRHTRGTLYKLCCKMTVSSQDVPCGSFSMWTLPFLFSLWTFVFFVYQSLQQLRPPNSYFYFRLLVLNST